MRRYPQIPQPFVLIVDPPGHAKESSSKIHWGMRLFGDSIKYWPYVVYTFKQAGEHGLGKARLQYDLGPVIDQLSGNELDLETIEPVTLEATTKQSTTLPQRCRLHWQFNTPLRLVRNERLQSHRLTPVDLIVAGKRRYETLNYFFGSNEATPARIFQPQEFRVVYDNVHSWGFRRFSGRQRRSIELTGLLGEMVIEGPWGEMGPWLSAAQVTHLGKATTFGFGQVSWSVV